MHRILASISFMFAALANSQEAPQGADSVGLPDTVAAKPRVGSELLIPAASLFLPGLGQYIHGETKHGLALSASALGGYALSATGDPWGDNWDGDFPRRSEDQLAQVAFNAAVTAGALSAYQAFRSAVPALQSRGKYGFIQKREGAAELLTAPFDVRFLGRWTTWVDLAQTAAVTALVLSQRDRGGQTYRFRPQDAGYSSLTSMNAAVTEEALFRGWLLPALYQNTGRNFWLANVIQAGAFGAAHVRGASLGGGAAIGVWAAWEGWIVKRNGWSIRESIFHHFWYDAAVITAVMLTEKKGSEMTITLPTIRF